MAMEFCVSYLAAARQENARGPHRPASPASLHFLTGKTPLTGTQPHGTHAAPFRSHQSRPRATSCVVMLVCSCTTSHRRPVFSNTSDDAPGM